MKRMDKTTYLNKLELKSILHVENKIETIQYIKNKFILIKSLGEIAIYSINTNALKFKIPLEEKINEKANALEYEFIFDYNYKLRLLNSEEKTNTYKLITDIYLIEINLSKNEWKIINKLEKGIYLCNLDVFIPEDSCILDQKRKTKIEFNLEFKRLHGIYEIKNKYLIINTHYDFYIFDINDNYKNIYTKENPFCPWGYKHPYILDDKTIVFSSILNIYVSNSEKYIFFDLNKFSERMVKSAPYDDGEYDDESCNRLFIIHRFKKNIYLQLEMVNDRDRKKNGLLLKKIKKNFHSLKNLMTKIF